MPINYKRPSWDEYFMTTAKLASLRSQDPSTKVGCAIVNHNKLVSMGYNGFPCGLDFEWEKKTGVESKYFYVVHAEANALINAGDTTKLNGATVYVTLFPCSDCAKLLVQAKVKKIIYLSDKYWNQESFKAARILLSSAGVELEQYSARNYSIVESTEDLNEVEEPEAKPPVIYLDGGDITKLTDEDIASIIEIKDKADKKGETIKYLFKDTETNKKYLFDFELKRFVMMEEIK